MDSFQLSEADKEKLRQIGKRLRDRTNQILGYPVVRDYDYREAYPLFDNFVNNVGDPYVPGSNGIHTKDLEREVISFFAKLLRAPADDHWGYITNGSTEGNLYGLFVARENLPKAPVFYSDATHYSVPKVLHILGMRGKSIKSQPNGEIGYDKLRAALSSSSVASAIVVANIGTTMTEAKDDVTKIKQILDESQIKDYRIHADAALAGTYTPLLVPRHPFDFADGADSIAISGYKFIGAPFPCGVVLVRNRHRKNIGVHVPYIASMDSTLSGSRNGHGPALLWYGIKRWGIDGLRHRAQACMELALYTQDKLEKMGWKAWRNPNSLTVVFDTPSEELCDKWQLAVHGPMAHIMCMPGLTKDTINKFLDEVGQAAKTGA